MGADTFTTIVVDKTMTEAFKAAQEEARYYHGHAGYTGTIAEKPGFREFRIPPQFPSDVPITALAELCFEFPYFDEDDDEVSDSEGGEPVLRWGTMEEGVFKRHERPVDTWLWEQLRPMAETAEDKWGDAVALDITDTHLGQQYLKTRPNEKGLRVFMFFGWASS